MAKFIDDEIIHISSDIKKIQIKPTVYIGHIGEIGAAHLVKEAINNDIDECDNDNKVGDTIYIDYDESEDIIEIADEGRAIQFDGLLISCTALQAGSKHSRSSGGGSSAGENGIGMTAMNALCEMFEIISSRYGESKILKFRDGELIVDKVVKVKSDKHGLTIRMKPSKVFLGSDARIPIDYIYEWITKISHMISSEIKIKFKTKRIDEALNVNKTFKNTEGLKGYLKTFAPKANLFRTPIVLEDKNSILEKDVLAQDEQGKIISEDVMRFIDLRIAMNYDQNSSEFNQHSFCNCIENIQHGFHQIAVKQAYLNYIKKQVKDSFTKKESNYEVQDNDVLNGLVLVVNLNTNHSTGFTPQTKEYLGNQVLLSPLRSLSSKMFNEFFRSVDGKKYLQSIIKMVKNNIEIRMSMNNARNRAKATMSFVDERSIKGYTPANNTGKKDYREIYFVEGESAGGGARGGRYDNGTQAILELKGKIDNVLNKAPHKAIEAPEIKKILDLLRCGIDKHYNEEDLYFQKLIILTDADVDGDHIAALIMLLLIMRAPKIIENGHLYRALTPLYKVKDTKRKSKKKKDNEETVVNLDNYLFDKKAFFDLYQKKVDKIIKIKVNKEDKYSTSAQLAAFLSVNSEYFELLRSLSKHYSCHSDILEYIADNLNTFRETIGDFYYELECIDGDTIRGPYDGGYTNLIINELLLKDLRKLNDIVVNYNNGNLHYHLYQSYSHTDTVYKGYMTIGQIMNICSQYEPYLETRFKGLGELDPEDLSALAFDPNNRRLVQVTMDDAKETVNTFLMLFSDKQMDIKKKLYMETEISMDDLDN